MLYTGEMATFNIQEREVKIFMETYSPEFWGSLVFKISVGDFIIYALFLKIRKNKGFFMADKEDYFEKYEEVPLYFSHYYNFLFIYKSQEMENGDQIFLQLGGNMEKVSAMVVDVNDPLTLNEKSDDEYAYIKNKNNRVIWK
jgi:hypothetical protein